MSSKNTGDGEKWSRTTEATNEGRQIKIEETNDEIRVTTEEEGTRRTVVAANAEELEKKDPAAFAIYRKYAGDAKRGPSVPASAEEALKKIGGARLKGFDPEILKELDGEGIKIFGADGLEGFKGIDGLDIKAFGAEGLKGFGAVGKKEAIQQMREQLRQLLDSDEVRGTPLEGAIRDLEAKLEAEE